MPDRTRSEGVPVGRAIRRHRDAADLTQVELAAAAGVSLDLIRRLEQEQRHTASIPSLHKIARALDIETGELLAKVSSLPKPTDESGVVAMRRVLTGIDNLPDDQAGYIDAPDLAKVQHDVTYEAGQRHLRRARPELVGTGNACAADSRKFGSWESNLMTEWRQRYGKPRPTPPDWTAPGGNHAGRTDAWTPATAPTPTRHHWMSSPYGDDIDLSGAFIEFDVDIGYP